MQDETILTHVRSIVHHQELTKTSKDLGTYICAVDSYSSASAMYLILKAYETPKMMN